MIGLTHVRKKQTSSDVHKPDPFHLTQTEHTLVTLIDDVIDMGISF